VTGGANHAGALLTAQDVAALLRVPVTWVYAEARAGRIPHVTLGRYRRFRREAIEAWLAGAERGTVR
jgi:excisionase family DNA binding protein